MTGAACDRVAAARARASPPAVLLPPRVFMPCER